MQGLDEVLNAMLAIFGAVLSEGSEIIFFKLFAKFPFAIMNLWSVSQKMMLQKPRKNRSWNGRMMKLHATSIFL